MNLGYIRQYLAELPDDKMVSAKELWKIFNAFAPIMTEEQEKQLVESLKSVYEKKFQEFMKEYKKNSPMRAVFRFLIFLP